MRGNTDAGLRIGLVLLTLLGNLSDASQAQCPPFVRYGTDEGISEAFLYDLWAHPDSTLWIGTDHGVTAFDGVSFRSFAKDSAQQSIGSVIRISGSDSGGLWMGSHKRGILHWDGERIIRTGCEVATSRGIAGTKTDWWVLSDSLLRISRSTQEVSPISRSTQWRQFVSLPEGGFLLVDSHTVWEIDYLGDTSWHWTSDVPLFSIHRSDTGQYWIGGQGSLGHWNAGQIHWFDLPDSLQVTQLFRDSRGYLWFSNRERGLYRWKDGTLETIGLFLHPDNVIPTDLLEDHNGHVWVSTLGQGLYRFYSPYMTSFAHPNVYRGGRVNRLRFHENDLYVAAEKGLFHFGNGTWSALPEKGHSHFSDIVFSSDHFITTITAEGTTEYNESARGRRRSLLAYAATLIGMDTLIHAYYAGIVSIDVNQQDSWRPVDHATYTEDLIHRTQCLVWYEGQIWQATTEGLRLLDRELQVTQSWIARDSLTVDTSFSGKALSGRVEDLFFQEDTVWVATESGIVRLHRNDSGWIPMDIRFDELKGITSVQRDTQLRWWIGTREGVYVFQDSTRIHRFTVASGLPSGKVTALRLDSAQRYVWVGTEAGVVRIDVHEWEQYSYPPPQLEVTRIVTRETVQTIIPRDEMEIDHLDFLHVHVHSHFPSEYGPIYYRYLLDGQDAGSSLEEHRLFRGLEAGEHRLTVQARSENSPWSEPVYIPFSVRIPWYQTQAFRIAVPGSLLLLALALSLIIQRARHKQHLERAHLREEQIRLQQQSLASLMRPHFVSNIVSAARTALREEHRLEGDQALVRLAELTRSNLHLLQQEFIPLTEEMDWLRTYLELESFIQTNDWKYTVECDPEVDLEQHQLPPMLIQPLVENAIVHGMPETDGLVSIHISRNTTSLLIRICDNGPGFSETTIVGSNSHSLRILRERLNALGRSSGETYALRFTTRTPQGTCAELTLPAQ